MRNTIVITAALLLCLGGATGTANARGVTGTVSFQQFGEPSEAVMKQGRAAAAADFRSNLRMWLRENAGVDLDTANTVHRFALDRFAARAVESAEENTQTRGRVWTLSLSASDAVVRSAMNAHNDHYGSQASTHFQAAGGDDPAALNAALNALANVSVKIEPPNTGNAPAIRARAQELLNLMEVKAAGTVIEGRPRAAPQKYPAAAFTMGGQPIEGFPMTAFIQNHRQFARMKTNSMGEISLRNSKTPFVHNGSMMTISPDARDYLKANYFIRLRDMGVRLTKNQELAFIFKVPALTYTLDFKVFTRESDIQIPADFSSDAHVRRYLREICGLTPATRGAADMNIRIGAELTRTVHDDTEEEVIAVAMRAEFKGGGIDLSHQKTFEKRYQYGINIQMGEFFWEASRAIREFIEETLAKE